MDKETVKKELDAIKTVLQHHQEGASIETINQALANDLGLRTLQRRLAVLLENKDITVTGQKRSTRYHLAMVENQQPAKVSAETEDIVPLSAEGQEIRKLLSVDYRRRMPVGYNGDFLESYRPNQDSYLSAQDKRKLAEIGRTGNTEQAAGTYAKQILQRLLIDLAWNSSRLEGNTYSLLDTQRLISQGETADDKTAAEAQMILNHKDAIEFIVEAVNEIGFNRYSLMNLHGMLSNNLLPDPAASGRLRTFGVGIGNSVFTPLAIPQQIEIMFDMMLAKTSQIEDPFEQAFFIMVQLPYLQPFDDVNKRVSRLAANIPFAKHNLSPLAFVDVPDELYIQGMLAVYELNRIELLKDVFMWAYERSALRYAALRQSLGEPDQFRLKYREQIRTMIAGIVSGALPPQQAAAEIKNNAADLPETDRNKFIETVETELLSLHDGNFARYRIKPSEFAAWKTAWNRS
ncbi:MAG: hypothetical protein JWR38_898 [Mucilaginibacter sp.]|nr:hypothetical protein [Mucilaginibacter sp.]